MQLPLLTGMSRKSMIGHVTGRAVDERLAGSIAAATIAALKGARIIRVHDVKETVDAMKVVAATLEETICERTENFGTDGVRGRVGEFQLPQNFAVKLGWAAGRVLAAKGTRKVLVGKDTRVGGYMLGRRWRRDLRRRGQC